MIAITAFYASILALFFVWLSLNVIKVRTGSQVLLGDGNNEALQTAISAQANAAQYIPFALLLIAFLEIHNANLWLLHALGLTLLSGRLSHALGILKSQIKLRVRGMQLTFVTLIVAAVFNLLYLVF